MKLKDGMTLEDLKSAIRESVSMCLDEMQEEATAPELDFGSIESDDFGGTEEVEPTAEYESTAGDNIVPFRRMPKNREEISEVVDFFRKSAETKFRNAEEGVRHVTQAFAEDNSLMYIAETASEKVKDILKTYCNKGTNEGAKEAYTSGNADRHLKDSSVFSNDTVQVGENSVKYTRHVEIPQWSLDLHECLSMDDKARNFEQVRVKITEELLNYFGGLQRIRKIYVTSYQLIINDVCYIPRLSKQSLSRLPFDCADYIANGCLAPFFNWSYILKMLSLNTLSFDDMDFVMSYVADDVGMGRDFKPVLLFKHCKGLSLLCIGSDTIKYPVEDEVTQEAVENIEKEAHRSNYFAEKCEKYYGVVFNTTKSVRKWSMNNLTEYATNRGDKGILRYTAGLTGRAIATLGFAVPEVAVRVGGGIFSGIASTIKNARNATVNNE